MHGTTITIKKIVGSVFRVKDGGSKFVLNVDSFLLGHTGVT